MIRLPPSNRTNTNELLNLQKFFYTAFDWSREARLLDMLIGRPSKFTISQLTVYGTNQREQASVSSLTIVEGLIRDTTSLQIELFNRPVHVTCTKGLPVYSSATEKYACRLNGKLCNDSALSTHFTVAEDVEGTWPPVSAADELWPDILLELEAGLSLLFIFDGSSKKCG